jgi:hypothetical protein
MTVILMRNTPVGRRAYAVSKAHAEKLVEAGDAVQDKVHTAIYEEVTDGERQQGYMTRNMEALSPVGRKRAKAAKPITEPESADTTPAEE